MARQRVCHLITDSVIIGGAETFLINLTAQLADQYDQTVICLTGNGALLDRLRQIGIEAVSVGMAGKGDLAALWRLVALVRRFRPEVLHTHLFHASLLGSIIGRLLRIPVVLSTEHTAGLHGYRGSMARIRTGLSDKVVAVSWAVREALVRVGVRPSKIEVIVNGLPLDQFQKQGERERVRSELGIPPGAVVIGKVAGFRPVKGHEDLVRAFSQVAGEFPCSLLLLVGDGVRRRPVEQLVRELGLSGRVIFAGFRQDVPVLLSAMDVLALASLWEGMPLSVLEAMAAGLAVVATRTGGIPEVVVEGETGLLVPPGDPAALAGALREVLRHPDRTQQMGEAGRRRMDGAYDIRRTAQAYHQVYQALLRRR